MFTIAASYQAYYVFAVILLAAVLMATNRVRYDLIALLVVLALSLTHILTINQALSGFGNTVVILIAGLLIIGEMLDRTGAARFVGDYIAKYGKHSFSRLTILTMIATALLSAVMSSTAVVAIFIPIVLRIAKQTSWSPSQLLLPMSYAALVSGMLTLIATPPNLVISAQLTEAGYNPLGFFSFSVIGVFVLALTCLLMVLAGPVLLPKLSNPSPPSYARNWTALWNDFRVSQELVDLRVSAQSPFCGRSIASTLLYQDYRVRILAVTRVINGQPTHFANPSADFILRPSDGLYVAGKQASIDTIRSLFFLDDYQPSQISLQFRHWELGAVSVLLHPNSTLIGRTLKSASFRERYGLTVFGLRRNQQAIEDFEQTPLASADSLLISGAWSKIKKLQQQNSDFVVLETPTDADDVVPAYQRLPTALAITGFMIGMALLNVIPLVSVVLIAVIAAVLTRCISANQAYQSIHWQSIVLLAGMLPLADALVQTGGTQMIVDGMLSLTQSASAEVMLCLLFAITVIMTNVLSNTASAVLMAPIAIEAANALEVSPSPFAVAVLLAASSAFLTPVASPVVTLVVEPGQYKLSDFLKMGLPLVIAVFATAYFFVPLLFPW